MTVDDVLDTVHQRLNEAGCAPKGTGRQRQARCPAHDDHSPSLSFGVGDRNPDAVGITCHAGCSSDDVVRALGLTLADLFVPTVPERPAPPAPTPPAEYVYTDAEGEVVGKVVRKAGKRFWQACPDGNGGWEPGGFGHHLYRLPQLLEAVNAGRRVLVVEGEKDADRAAEAGLVATSSVGGAGKWRDHLAGHFAGGHVVVIADNDRAGIDHAEQVATSLHTVAAEVKVVRFDELGTGADLAEWLDRGGTVDALARMVDEAPAWGDAADSDRTDEPTTTSWARQDLAGLLDGHHEPAEPTVLSLFYPGKLNGLWGESESGKTWVALHAAATVLAGGGAVVYLDFEDDAASLIGRLQALGADRAAILERFAYVQPDEALSTAGWADLSTILDALTPALVVVDATADALSLHGLKTDEEGFTALDHLLLRPLVKAGPAVVLIDHVPKSKDNRSGPSGTQRKRAAISGAAYFVEQTKSFTPTKAGMARLTIGKDRPGAVRARHPRRAGDLHLVPNGARLDVELSPPEPESDGQSWRPTALMERTSRLLEDAPEPLSRTAVVEAVTGRSVYVRQALDALVAEGFAVVESGPGGAQLHRSSRPFREGTPSGAVP